MNTTIKNCYSVVLCALFILICIASFIYCISAILLVLIPIAVCTLLNNMLSNKTTVVYTLRSIVTALLYVVIWPCGYILVMHNYIKKLQN